MDIEPKDENEDDYNPEEEPLKSIIKLVNQYGFNAVGDALSVAELFID